jgi:hypothetical protein
VPAGGKQKATALVVTCLCLPLNDSGVLAVA